MLKPPFGAKLTQLARSFSLSRSISMEVSSLSSPVAVSGEDPNSQTVGTASGGLQAEGVVSAGAGDAGGTGDAEFGFQRPDMGKEALAGTVHAYERHVFLCYKGPQAWPSRLEAAESDRLPRLLSAAIVARRPEMKKRTWFTICEGEDGTDSSNGDILIFPDMIRYRRLTHFDVDKFVEEVLVKETEWLPGVAETLVGSYIFVCSHGSRDRRCGVCGPVLIKKFKEEISSRGHQGQVSVSPCSHVGGHKYAGNVIIFTPNLGGEVTGHWYGYVTPDDVPVLLDQHVAKGEIVDRLWRGQMGLSEEDQKKAHERRLQLNDKERSTNGKMESAGCCQGVGNATCCQNGLSKEKLERNLMDEQKTLKITEETNKESDASCSKEPSARKNRAMPKWFGIWEREETYAALAVGAAIATVAFAFTWYRQPR